MVSFEQAKVLHERGQLDEALQAYNEILNNKFDDTNALFYAGTALCQMGKNGLAANILMQAAVSDPNNTKIMQNLANCYKMENKSEEAEDIIRMALQIKENADLWGALGNIYINNGTPKTALGFYEQGLKMEPNNDLLKFHKGLAQLEAEEWEEGWKNYDRGFNAGNRIWRDYKGLGVWKGDKDKTVIVWGEQGVGDELMFASILPDMIRDCKRVIFDCHPRLVDTFERSFGIEVHGTRKNQVLEWVKTTEAEKHCSMTVLGTHYRKKAEDFPKKPYLKANADVALGHRKTGNGRLRVGISWSGGIKLTRSDLRSVKLEQLIPILRNDCDFYSFQYTPDAAREVCELEEKHGIRVKHFPGLVECQNYDHTINFLASMDLVISVCTTVVHAAGGLGIPVWVLTPSKPAWRYCGSGTTHAWYGSAKMFRQKPKETWEPIIQKISEELCAYNRQVQTAKLRVA